MNSSYRILFVDDEPAVWRAFGRTLTDAGCAIDFVAPAREGDRLTAFARECSVSGRTGVYDIEVTNQDSERIAFFRGKSYRIKGHVIEQT